MKSVHAAILRQALGRVEGVAALLNRPADGAMRLDLQKAASAVLSVVADIEREHARERITGE